MQPALDFIPIARPSIGDEEVRAAERVLRSGWLTQGPEVEAFEREFAAWTGAPHACAVSSATAALQLALLAVGVRPGDEVVTVSHSFIATANAIVACGAVPVFVDIDPATYNIDPARVEQAVSARTKAILCVHQLGMPCDVAALAELAKRRGLFLVEDAACAAGSEVLWAGQWQRIGRPHGDIACFSFHPRKAITTGDGGMLVTRNGEWDARFRLLRQHGMSISDAARHAAAKVVLESYTVPGFNFRLTDLQAAVGRAQLDRLAGLVEERRRLAQRYAGLLAGDGRWTLPVQPSWARSNWQSFCLRLDARFDQKAVMQAMLDRGVATRRGVMCAHREPAYPASAWRAGPGGLPESERAQDQSIILPLYAGMTDRQQERVVESLREACA